VIDRVRGALLDVAHDASPRTHVLLVGEDVPPAVVRRAEVSAGFLLAGWDPRTARDALNDLDAEEDDPTLWPTLVRIGKFIRARWIRARFLVKGGVA